MYNCSRAILLSSILLGFSAVSNSQTEYQVVHLSESGKISGTVKWSGPMPRLASFPVTKDPKVCDPDSRKKVDLERLIVSADGGVANTVVYLKNISSGKPMDV